MAISDLRNRPDFAEPVADRVWRAFWKDKGHPLSLLTGLVQESLGEGPVPSCFVAHDGDIFLGTASLIACDEETRPQYTPWIAAVWVEPDHRGQGIGAALIARAAEFAFGAGAGRVYLLAGPHRRSFYEGLGWSVLETLSDGMFVLTRDAGGSA
ncbi:GNAT family N-acetyltransferase [Microvirga splendida]|uniref:GNAT family N-acetyltransferase n=1 Tax=Microvirga splendida TaxID=2795727 RepID=A0ABS0Y0P2_9HYPH|nr:GNAT family N-acetyltransferase [Microvirga splendida]MBJ6125525.1 GNAT family N-acetyltransferase [Microvirga splendida]